MSTRAKQHYVYKITCQETGEYYYGKRSCRGSWKEDTSYMGSGQLLSYKRKAHPEYQWTKEVLLLLDSAEEALEYERIAVGERYIGGSEYDGLCLNLCAGGKGSAGHTKSEETRARMSEALRGRTKSEETRARMSAAKKGHTVSEETRQRIAEGNKGKTHTEAARAKIGAASKGNKHALGCVRSEETRQRMSAANKGQTSHNKGKTASEETRAKQSEAKRAYWAKKRAEKEAALAAQLPETAEG